MAQGNIPSYDPTMPGVRVDEAGVESAAQAANRINRIYTEVGSNIERTGHQAGVEIGGGIRDLGQAVEDSMYHKELSRGSALEAQLVNSLTQTWDKTIASADPNDPNVAARFQQGPLQEQMDKFSKSFTTERGVDWAQRRIEAITQHFVAKNASDMGLLASKAVEKNLDVLSNDWSNTAIRDPGSLPFLLRSADDHVKEIINSSPNLRGVELAAARETLPQKMKEALVKAAAIGAIQKSADPEATAAAYSAKYPDYIKGAEVQTLAREAKAEIRAARADQRWQMQQEKEERQELRDKTMDAYVTQALDDPKNFDMRKAFHDPGLAGDWRGKENLHAFIERENKPETEAKVSRSTFADLGTRIINDPKSVTIDDLMKARTKPAGEAGGLTQADFNELRTWLFDPAMGDTKLSKFRAEAVKGVMPLIDHSNPMMGHLDQTGHLNYAKFLYAVHQAEEEYRNTPGKNVFDLFNPNKPDYVGNPKFYQPFLTSMDQSINSFATGITGAPQYGPGGK